MERRRFNHYLNRVDAVDLAVLREIIARSYRAAADRTDT